MQFSTLILPVAFTLVAAQYGDSSGGSSSSSMAASASGTTSATPSVFTSTAGKVVHKVAVGKNGLSFTPDNLNASVGDEVEFHFYPATHSVVQSSFASPCSPLNDTSFFSGGFKTASGVNTETFTITINDTKPIWYYCGAPSHCQSGMVGVINVP
jgi:plastocyanin